MSRPPALLACLSALTLAVAPSPAQQPRPAAKAAKVQKTQAAQTDEAIRQRLPAGVKFVPNVAYRDGASKYWRLDLFVPEGRGGELRPGLVFVHGGGWRGGDKRSGAFLKGAIDYAGKGYVTATVNYRLTDEAPFPACAEDVKCAVRWLRAHAKDCQLDVDRVGGFGNSAGAHLVALLGLARRQDGLEGDGPHQDQSSQLQAVCCAATPADFLLWEKAIGSHQALQPFFAGAGAKILDVAKRASPVTYARADAPPFLVIHGTKDTTVNVAHADRLVEALKQAGARDVTYLRLDGEGHGVFGTRSGETHPAMEQFFARTLQARPGSR